MKFYTENASQRNAQTSSAKWRIRKRREKLARLESTNQRVRLLGVGCVCTSTRQQFFRHVVTHGPDMCEELSFQQKHLLSRGKSLNISVNSSKNTGFFAAVKEHLNVGGVKWHWQRGKYCTLWNEIIYGVRSLLVFVNVMY